MIIKTIPEKEEQKPTIIVLNNGVYEISDGDRFIGSKEIAQLVGCSVPTAREIMHRKDFPIVRIGKNLKVMKSAFVKWASERRV